MPITAPTRRREPPLLGEEDAEEDEPEPFSLVDEEDGFLSVEEMVWPSPPPPPPQLFGAAAEIMEAASRRRIRAPSPEPRRRVELPPRPRVQPQPRPCVEPLPLMGWPVPFEREVDQLMRDARARYDQALLQVEAARNLAQAYEVAVGAARPNLAHLPPRPPGTSGWILSERELPRQQPPLVPALPGLVLPGQGSDRTRERRRLRAQASGRKAGLPYYIYEDQQRPGEGGPPQ